jgi:hypothetical protein
VGRGAEGGGEGLGRLADQVGAGDARKERAQRLDAAGLGPAAGDPADPLEGGERAGRRLGVGRLGVVDDADAAPGRHGLGAVRQAGEGGEAGLDRLRGEAERARHGVGGAGVLVVVAARQGEHRAQVERRDLAAAAPFGEKAAAGGDRPAGGQLGGHRDGDDRLAGAGLLAHDVGEEAALGLVDADHRSLGAALGEEPALGGEIAADAAVAVEVVGREVEEDRDVGLERAGELGLVGGELEHHRLAVAERVERQHAAADVAAIWTGRPAVARMWATSAVVVDLPFEPVIATTWGARSKRAQSSVAWERKKSPTSLSTATPACQAAATAGCGAG